MKLTPELKEIAQRVINSMYHDGKTVGNAFDFLEGFLDALQNSDPVAYHENGRWSFNSDGGPDKWRERKKYNGPLYAAPSIPQDYKAQLAESQVREAKLRDVLTQVREQCLFSDDEGEIGVSNEAQIDLLLFDAICMAIKSTDASALNELITKAGEVMRERCFQLTRRPHNWLGDQAQAYCNEVQRNIRALPGVTLEDLNHD